MKARRGLTLAVVRDLREQRPAATPDELAGFETAVLAGSVLSWYENKGLSNPDGVRFDLAYELVERTSGHR